MYLWERPEWPSLTWDEMISDVARFKLAGFAI